MRNISYILAVGLLTMGCGSSGGDDDGFSFRDDAPSAYTRVDAMGMPAVSTALVPSESKDAYQDATPDTASLATGLLATLDGLIDALEDDLMTASLVGCADAATCVGQEVATGVTVADLVIPDALNVNTEATAGFPNGRRLEDPVIDITLAVILLDLSAMGQSPASLVGVLNPAANDVAFLSAFPYLAGPATAP